MKSETMDVLMEIGANENHFNSLYRNVSTGFNLPDGRMWILYFLIFSDEKMTQMDIADRMMLSRQTINSAAKSLEETGMIELTKLPGSKQKQITLTPKGCEFANRTVGRLIDAECRAVERMGDKKIRKFIELYDEFYQHLKQEFQEEGIIDT